MMIKKIENWKGVCYIDAINVSLGVKSCFWNLKTFQKQPKAFVYHIIWMRKSRKYIFWWKLMSKLVISFWEYLNFSRITIFIRMCALIFKDYKENFRGKANYSGKGILIVKVNFERNQNPVCRKNWLMILTM